MLQTGDNTTYRQNLSTAAFEHPDCRQSTDPRATPAQHDPAANYAGAIIVFSFIFGAGAMLYCILSGVSALLVRFL